MNPQKSKPFRAIPTIGAATARTLRVRLTLAVLVAGIAIVFLGYRVLSTLNRPRPAPLLSLGANVPLLDPPPLPDDDREAVQAPLQRLVALRSDARLRTGSPAVHLEVAGEALNAGDPLAAYEEFRAAFRKNPPADSATYDAYGLSALQLGLYPQALEIYKSMIARWPNRVGGYIGLTRAQYFLGAMRQAVATLDRASRAVPAEAIADRLEIANEYEQKGDSERALTMAQAVRAGAPDDPAALHLTAHLLFKLARIGEARPLLEKLVAAHSEDTAARIDLATVIDDPMQPHRDRALAEHLLLQALQRNPNDTRAYMQLGTLYQEQGRFRQAAYVCVRWLQITPDSAAGRLQLSKAYAGLGDTRRAAAQQAIAQQLLARDTTESHLSANANHHATDPQARLALARYYARSGQFGNALAQFQAAYCLAPTSPDTRRALAALYDRIGVPEMRSDIDRFTN